MYVDWVVIARVPGQLEAEILRGLMTSFEIPCELAQESAGKVYGLTVGRLGEVQLLVPAENEKRAHEVLDAYHRGELAAPENNDVSGSGNEPEDKA
jgi:hypothetical protein